jgi:hypothetical protein
VDRRYCESLAHLTSSDPPLFSCRARLQRKHDEKLEEMKTEALGKLKELGNSFLGNFGMSLDNFKMEQDKTTGSWSIRSGSIASLLSADLVCPQHEQIGRRERSRGGRRAGVW